MLKRIRQSYEHTIYASYGGYITQAIINNFAPLLFLTFASDFNLTLDQITLITTINFLVQLGVDLVSAKVVDRIGYRPCIVFAHIVCAAGLIGLAVLPSIMAPYAGIMTAVVLYAIGGGIIEVLISPIVEACPTKKKEAAMSLLHSFYCWGHVFLVVVSTAFFAAFGIGSWRVLACIWALVPLVNVAYFSLVPLYPIVAEEEKKLSITGLFKQKVFWLLMVLMVCAGASEQAMSQWASAFAESGLNVSKTMGDLAGPCLFAVLMGISRVFYSKMSEKLDLTLTMLGCGALCVVCYLMASLCASPVLGLLGCALCGISVGIMWPGTLSISAQKCPKGGTVMFALLALAGDLGGSVGPSLVGGVSSMAGGDLKIGLLAAIVFPVLLIAGLIVLKKWVKVRK